MVRKVPSHFSRIPPTRTGIRCRCPRCGQGEIYSGLLTVTNCCACCGLDLSPHDTGDGASVFVIFILGALIVPLAFWLEVAFAPPIWLHLMIWPPVIMVFGIAFLRPVKATLIAIHFKNLRHKYNE